MAIDYGTKRVGLAVTDPLQIVASALDTIHAKDIFAYLKKYTEEQQVDTFVVGMPKNLQNNDTNATQHVKGFVKKLEKTFSNQNVVLVDERFTSKMAFDAMIASGIKKKGRQNKAMVDQVSAVIILQSYMDSARSF